MARFAGVLVVLFVVFASSALAVSLPVVVSVEPENAAGTSVDTQVSATFSKSMNASSINEESFVLRQRTTPADGEVRERVIEGTVVYDEQSLTATFTPDHRLMPNQEFGNVFTATITTDVRDADGYALEHPYVWSFTSGDYTYNTGASTSQQNSTASEVNGTNQTNSSAGVAVPVGDEQAASPEQEAAGLGTWPVIALVAGGLLLAFLLFFAISALGRSRTDTDDDVEPLASDDKVYDHVYPVQEVEGIGSTYAAKLQEAGIMDTAQLVRANTGVIAKLLSVGARTVRSWQKRASLMMVNGVGKQYAELLERSGVHSVDDLAVARPERLLADVRDKQESVDISIQGRKPSKRIVSSWIDSARSHQQRRRGET